MYSKTRDGESADQASVEECFRKVPATGDEFICQSLCQVAGVSVASEVGQLCEAYQTFFWTEVVLKSRNKRVKSGWKAEFDKGIFNQRSADACPWMSLAGVIKNKEGNEVSITTLAQYIAAINYIATENSLYRTAAASGPGI